MAIIAASLLPLTVWAQTGGSPAAGLPALVNLSPGSDLRIRQNVDVNVFLIGFGGLLDPATLLAQSHLPAWNGVPKANGSGQTFICQRFDFRYHVTMAPAWFENSLSLPTFGRNAPGDDPDHSGDAGHADHTLPGCL